MCHVVAFSERVGAVRGVRAVGAGLFNGSAVALVGKIKTEIFRKFFSRVSRRLSCPRTMRRAGGRRRVSSSACGSDAGEASRAPGD